MSNNLFCMTSIYPLDYLYYILYYSHADEPVYIDFLMHPHSSFIFFISSYGRNSTRFRTELATLQPQNGWQMGTRVGHEQRKIIGDLNLPYTWLGTLPVSVSQSRREP